MASSNLPPLRREIDDYLQIDDSDIFKITAVNTPNNQNYKALNKNSKMQSK